MSLDHWLKRLDAAADAHKARRPCPACGEAPGAANRCVLAPIELDDAPPLDGPDLCLGCGRRRVVPMVEITPDERYRV